MRPSMRAVRSSCFVAALVLLGLPVPSARAQVIGEAVELERTGRQARAVVVYLAVLRGEPTNLTALLGLERVLPPLGRLPELLPLVRRVTAPGSPHPPLLARGGRSPPAPYEADSAEGAAPGRVAAPPRREGRAAGGEEKRLNT